MNMTTSARAAVIVAAGLWIGGMAPIHANDAVAAPADQATAVGSATDTSAEPAKPKRRYTRKSADGSAAKSRRTSRQSKATVKDAATTDAQPAAQPAESTAATDAKPDQGTAAMSPAVANANAQWGAQAAPGNTYNISSQAGNVIGQMGATPPEQPATASLADPAATAEVVAPDQLNDLDKAAAEQPPLTLAKATIDSPAPPAPAEANASADTNSPWQQTSFVGKLFIAFGGLLTLASAARMFIA